MNTLSDQESGTSAFPYTAPYTNPYTQRKKTQPQQPLSTKSNKSSSVLSSSSQSSSPQQQLNHALKALTRSSQIPSIQTVQHLFEHVNRAHEQAELDSLSSSASCWTLELAEHLVSFVVRIFGRHANIDMTDRNPEGYAPILCFLARSLQQWSLEDSIMYAVTVNSFPVQITTLQETEQHQHQPTEMSILQVLHSLVTQFQDPILQNPALVGLSAIWRYLDRIQFLTSWQNPIDQVPCALDSAWWMPSSSQQEKQSLLASMALRELCSNSNDKNDCFPKTCTSPDRGELRLASITILTSLLKHDQTTWLHDFTSSHGNNKNEDMEQLCQSLCESVKQLGSSSINALASNQSPNLSIASASLLCLMDCKVPLKDTSTSIDVTRLVHSTKLLENSFKALFGVFGPSSPSGPRWTYEHNKDVATRRWIEDFLFNWSICKDGEARKQHFDALERHWRPYVEQWLNMLMTENFDNNCSAANNKNDRHPKRLRQVFSTLVLLNSIHHSTIRGILIATMSRLSNADQHSIRYLDEPCKKLLQELFLLSQNPDLSISVCAVSLLKSLLGGRDSIVTHDEVSRCLWKAVHFRFAQTCMKNILRLSSHSDSNGATTNSHGTRPLLLNCLDVLDLVLSSEPILREVIHQINAESLEALIHLMSPKEIRIDQAGAFCDDSQETALMEDFENDTPPANNLSRLDENSICIEKEETEEPRTGIDHFVRVAAATVLSRFGYYDIDNQHHIQNEGRNNLSSIRILQMRIKESVTEFFSSLTPENVLEGHSGDLASDACGTITVSMEMTRRRFRLLTSMAVPENEEFLSSHMFAKETIISKYRAQLEKAARNEAKLLEVAAQREIELNKTKEECQKRLDAQSVRMLRDVQKIKKTAGHELQAKLVVLDAERKAAECRLKEAEIQLKNAEQRVQEADSSAKASHESEALVRLELEDITAKAKVMSEENRGLNLEVKSKADIISDMTERMKNMEDHQKKSEEIMADQENAITKIGDAKDSMENNLNNLFSDLVKLSTMYETEEKIRKELESQQRAIHAENERVKAENEELQSKLSSLKSLEDENALLQSDKVKLEKKTARYKEIILEERKQRKEKDQRSSDYKKESTSYFHNLNDKSSTHSRSYAKAKNEKSSRASARSRVKENESSRSPWEESSRSRASARSRGKKNESSISPWEKSSRSRAPSRSQGKENDSWRSPIRHYR